MTDKQITVPSVFVDSMLELIENHLLEIGKTYQSNGRSFQDDVEITAFRAMAQQLGYDFEISSIAAGFSVIRHPYSPAE